MTDRTRTPAHPILASFMILAGVIGWIAAFALTMERIGLLQNPGSAASCDFSLLVQCTVNLESKQGAIFGFPNSLIGVAAWIIPIVVGVAMLAGARFARWFWALFNLGLLGAIILVGWLIGQSVFVLGTLCPWCMVTWAVTIPLFIAVTLHNIAEGNLPLPRGARAVGRALRGWIVLIVFACYVLVAVLAQLRLNVVQNLF